MKKKKSMLTILGVLLLSFSIVGGVSAEPYRECDPCGGGNSGGGGGGGGGFIPPTQERP